MSTPLFLDGVASVVTPAAPNDSLFVPLSVQKSPLAQQCAEAVVSASEGVKGPLICEVFTREEYDAFKAAGTTAGAPVDTSDGFIHMSSRRALPETVALYFSSHDEVFLLGMDPASLLAKDLRWEPAPSRGEAFPHLYRPLNVSDVVWEKHVTLL